MSTWQPIDTALKNGLPIVAAQVAGIHWLPACVYWDRLISAWCTCDGGHVFHPTHWMPLPPPPLGFPE